MKCLAYMQNGVLSVVRANPKLAPEDIEQALISSVQDGAPYTILDESELPAQYDYRRGWRVQGGTVVEDIAACREVYRNWVREQRADMFPPLDAAYQIADEQGDVARKAEIATERQRLRDAPADPRIDSASTVDQLRVLDVL